MKKTLVVALSVALVVVIGLFGTFAYFTDNTGAANVFTDGSVEIELTEDFEQGVELLPGKEIKKIPVITNTGKSNAYVWLTFSIPSALDNWNPGGGEEGSNNNIIHWNPSGSTHEGYVTEERVEKAVANGFLPDGTTAEQILSTNSTWDVINNKLEFQEMINGVAYNTYVLQYNKAIAPGETTLPTLSKIFMDTQIDMLEDGTLVRVVDGVATPVKGVYKDETDVVTELGWNMNIDGTPVLYVNAYAIQADGLTDKDGDSDIDVDDAYKLYIGQWGKLNGEKAVVVEDKAALEKALNAGSSVALAADIAVDGNITLKEGATLVGNGHTLSDAQLYMADGSTVEGVVFDGTEAKNGSNIYAHDVSVTIKDCTFIAPAWDAIQATTKVDNVTFVIDGCTFEQGEAASYRQLHVEVADKELRKNADNNVKAVITNNTFKDIDACTDDGITIVGVFENNLTVSGNKAIAASAEAANDEVWVGYVGNGDWEMYDPGMFEATYTAAATTADEFTTAIAAGGDILLEKDVTLAGLAKITKDATIDLGGSTLTAEEVNGYDDVLTIRAEGVTLKNGTVKAETGYAVAVGHSGKDISGGLTIESGTYTGKTTAVQVGKGELIIKGGYFEAEPYEGSYEFTINCMDAPYKNETAKVTIIGGTFFNFDPSNNASEGIGTDYVPEGYKVITEEDGNGNTLYTVVAE